MLLNLESSSWFNLYLNSNLFTPRSSESSLDVEKATLEFTFLSYQSHSRAFWKYYSVILINVTK